MERRVVVTGVGAISPLGLDVPSLWQGIVEARSGVRPITLFDAQDFETYFAGEAPGFDPTNYMDRKEARRTDRFVQLAIAATQEALRTSELSITPENSESIGIFIGNGIGGLQFLSEQQEVFRTRGPSRVSPFLVPAMIANLAAGQVSIVHDLRGPSMCTTSACASSGHAIGEGAEVIRRGHARAMIVGGCEAPITPISLAAFNSIKAISTRNDSPTTASRPFDKTRDGFILSEGAAILVIEDMEFAQSRGAPMLAEIVSYASTSDAHHITHPPENGEGAARAMKLALAYGNVSIDEIDYINAHGTSTQLGDIAETRAVKEIFGERAWQIPVSSTKSNVGHLVGAAGGIETIVTILAMQNSIIPPTINLHHPDPQCDLDYVPNEKRQGKLNTVLKNSFGFGGHNTSIVLRRVA